MKTTRICLTWIAALLTLALGGCGNFTAEPVGSAPNELSYKAAISDCGGFGVEQYAPPPPDTDDDLTEYCAAERLVWSFDAETGELAFENTRISLNCCGVHSMDIALDQGVYVLTERDEPENGSRCSCMCVYDFHLAVEEMPAETIQVALERVVTDWPEASGLMWSGEIDLSTGSGVILVDSTPMGYPCQI
ncbi:MAG: hypothetical protein MUC50_17185 [Myxococcota bacterium]|jgi:hypothetical protein|nr:hypothetical protein [Myxococcota bacterium]